MTVFELIDWEQPLENLEMWDRNPETIIKRSVQSESNPEQCYLVRKVSILSKPFEQADAVADQTEITLCSCPDATYRKWFDSEPDVITSGISCKHTREAFRTEKAKNDENQTQLDNPIGK